MGLETSVALNNAMKRIRSGKRRNSNPNEPIRTWIDKDRTPEGTGKSLTIVFNTDGCRWARAGGCTMCGYVGESSPGAVDADSLLNQLEAAVKHEEEQGVICDNVKIYTSGTFFDEREIPLRARNEILDRFSDRWVVVESLPDFVKAETIEDASSRVRHLDIAIGLETADDHVRSECVNKYFDFNEYLDAVDEARSGGAGVKTYLLMKPPFLTEEEAIKDMVYSIERAAPHSDVVSMNPCNVQNHTLVDKLYREEGFRPPWLWSIHKVLEKTSDVDCITVSHPVAPGKSRGPHNCGDCDEAVYNSIIQYSLTGDSGVLDEVSCSCREVWMEVLDREKPWNAPLEAYR